jgi:bacillithiol biosynthesis deacetylase BshB1
MADGFFKNDETNQRKLIAAIRKYQPEIVFCNAPEDRHPDHGRAAQLTEDACFLSGLKKIETFDIAGQLQDAWRPKYVFNFIQDRYLKPDFVVDITASIDKKMDSIRAYGTQFYNPNLAEPQTYISAAGFIEGVLERAKMFGKMIGVPYAEGFISKKTIGLSGFDALILKNT